MKKLIIIGVLLVAVFGGILFLTKQESKVKEESADNPYKGKEDVHPASLDLVGNKNYDTITLPDEVDKKIKSGEPTYVYFFSPTCGYCMEMTPMLTPLAKDMGVPILQYNLLEYGYEAESYKVEGTPTLIYFDKGKEVSRVVGLQGEETTREFLKQK